MNDLIPMGRREGGVLIGDAGCGMRDAKNFRHNFLYYKNQYVKEKKEPTECIIRFPRTTAVAVEEE